MIKGETTMKQNIIYVGLDVDDTKDHGSALDKNTGEVLEFKCRPTRKRLLGQLEKLSQHFPGCLLKLSYETSYIGSIQPLLSGSQPKVCCLTSLRISVERVILKWRPANRNLAVFG